MFYFIVALSSFILSLILSKLTIKVLSKKKILDIPTSRSNHASATLRGGGLAIASTICIAYILYYIYSRDANLLYVFSGLLIISSVSFIDDIKNLSIKTRIIFQGLSIFILLIPVDLVNSLFFIIIFLSFFAFINFYNFMDGIDGLDTSETIHISLSIFILSFFAPNIPAEIRVISLTTCAACLGFIKFNWHPAKIFLGDVGSISLGFICAWMLFNLFYYSGLWAATLIIPMVFLADSGITLLKRIIARKKIWKPHSEHFYQQAVRNGQSHSKVTKKIIYCNLALFVLSIMSLTYPILSFGIAVLLVVGLLHNLQRSTY